MGLARRGEDAAEAWYRDRGYEVLARNWRCRYGEIDLVVARSDVMVISEVKTRTSDFFGRPAEAVGVDKQRRLRRLAREWLVEHGQRRRSIRFDVVEVLVVDDRMRVQVIESAF